MFTSIKLTMSNDILANMLMYSQLGGGQGSPGNVVNKVLAFKRQMQLVQLATGDDEVKCAILTKMWKKMCKSDENVAKNKNFWALIDQHLRLLPVDVVRAPGASTKYPYATVDFATI